MNFTPRPWQRPMIDFITKNRRANLWADMGSGKSVSVLSALDILQMAGSNFFPVLVLAPLRVARDVWPAEMGKWDHLKALKLVPIIGNAQERLRALHQQADIYCMNYENIPWLVEACGDRWPFLTVIADESTKLKGFRLRTGTKRAAALAQISRKTQRWLNLTGTPAPNGLKDLWGQNWFLDGGERLGKTWMAFKERWFDYDQYSRELSPKKDSDAQIYKALADNTLSIQMKDWVDLREPIHVPVYVNLPVAAMKQYRKLEQEMFVELAQDVELTALSAAAKSTKCLQFCAGAAYYDSDKWHEIHSAKLDALDDIIEETAGANLLVSYWWRHDAERIKKRFPQARTLKTKQDEDDWNGGKVSLLLAHPQSAGHGLNLQFGGHHLVTFSAWWNLEMAQQILERIGPVRQMQSGFDRPVYIHEILVRDTIDELVAERHQGKAAVQELLMRAMRKGGKI